MTETENKQSNKLIDWINGDYAPAESGMITAPEGRPRARVKNRVPVDDGAVKIIRMRRLGRYLAVVGTLLMMIVLLLVVMELPLFGDASSPVVNEVLDRYLYAGLEETGATNLVGGLILNYRGFDTFGEATVLFIAMTAVLLLLKNDRKNFCLPAEKELLADEAVNGKYSSIILSRNACVVVPFLLVFALYVMFNGHLSPGGGFSGGAILGGALILGEVAFGSQTMRKLFRGHIYHIIAVCSTLITCVEIRVIAAHLGDHGHPFGVYGNIISAGFIMPLNVLVGIEVGCIMYSFYSLFSRGDI